MTPPFATDTDLLHWEPGLFIDAAAAAQTLLGGTGDLAGTLFTVASGSLGDAQIAPDHVIVLGVPIDGCFPVLKIESDTELTLSVLYDQLDPNSQEADPDPVSPGEGTDVPFHIRTFWPQRQAVSDQILQAAGIKHEEIGTIANPEILRRPCVLGTLQMIFTALATGESASVQLARAELYGRLYRRALRNAMVEIDTDADGIVDERRSLSVIQLRRR